MPFGWWQEIAIAGAWPISLAGIWGAISWPTMRGREASSGTARCGARSSGGLVGGEVHRNYEVLMTWPCPAVCSIHAYSAGTKGYRSGSGGSWQSLPVAGQQDLYHATERPVGECSWSWQ